MRTGAPQIGGSFPVSRTLFSISDCSLVWLQGKEDPWNSVTSGALTCTVLDACSDLPAMDGPHNEGSTLPVLIKGIGTLLTCYSAQLVCNTPQFLEGIKEEPGPRLAQLPAKEATACLCYRVSCSSSVPSRTGYLQERTGST